MQVTQISADGLKRAYRISVPAADIEDKLIARLTDLGREVRVPGFRAGKVPLSVLRQRFGDAVKGEILQSAIADATTSTIDGEGIRPAMQPDIDDLKFEDGEDLEYTLALELMPEIEPLDCASIELERMVVEAEESEIDRALSRLAEQHRHFSPAEDGAEAGDGDEVRIDFEGRIDGTQFEGGAAQDFVLRLGSGQLLPGFEEQLLGVKAGEVRFVEIDFPGDYPNDRLAGEKASFAVTVRELRKPDEAAVDDSLARHLGLDDLDALRTALRGQIEEEYERVARARLKRGLLDLLADRHGFELPPGMVAREFDGIWAQLEEAREKDELDDDDKALSEDALRARYREIAERRVRLALLAQRDRPGQQHPGERGRGHPRDLGAGAHVPGPGAAGLPVLSRQPRGHAVPAGADPGGQGGRLHRRDGAGDRPQGRRRRADRRAGGRRARRCRAGGRRARRCRAGGRRVAATGERLRDAQRGHDERPDPDGGRADQPRRAGL